MSLPKKPLAAPTLVSSTVPGDVFERIANALERLAPPHPRPPDFTIADPSIWYPRRRTLAPFRRVNRLATSLFKGIYRSHYTLAGTPSAHSPGSPAIIT